MRLDSEKKDYVCCGVVVDKKPSGTDIKLSCTKCGDVLYLDDDLEGCPECNMADWDGVKCYDCGYGY